MGHLPRCKAANPKKLLPAPIQDSMASAMLLVAVHFTWYIAPGYWIRSLQAILRDSCHKSCVVKGI
jgi:hypothetical protein